MITELLWIPLTNATRMKQASLLLLLSSSVECSQPFLFLFLRSFLLFFSHYFRILLFSFRVIALALFRVLFFSFLGFLARQFTLITASHIVNNKNSARYTKVYALTNFRSELNCLLGSTWTNYFVVTLVGHRTVMVFKIIPVDRSVV